MSLPTINSLQIENKNVFVRCSLDVPIENGNIKDDSRLIASLDTLRKLRDKGAKRIYIAGHMGRPEGDFDKSLSTKQLIEWYKQNLEEDVYYIPFMHHDSFHSCPILFKTEPHRFFLLENLRFWNGEKENNPEFVNSLDSLAEVYINDAFDVSHRDHASITGLPKVIERGAAFGESFLKEYSNLEKIRNSPERPFILLLSGVKEDKLNYLDRFLELADKVLIAGKLPDYLDEDYSHPKAMVAKLIQDKEDITLRSIENFESEIARAKTVVVSGPIGKYEDEGHRQGTERVLTAVANSNAFTLAGGGDTGAALQLLGLEEKFDWVSIAGGAMLDYLADGSLPGIDAIIESQ